MKSLLAFLKKEILENIRNGKFIFLIILFTIFGIINPAITKFTPYLLKLFANELANNGIVITNLSVNAINSWAQFFKNIPLVLIAFGLSYCNIFTKEYEIKTLILILTKGLERYKVVLAKTILVLGTWTIGYWLSFLITYGYNAYYWDNSIVDGLYYAIVHWWLFGIWTLCLMILFSTLVNNYTSVAIATGCSVLATYLISFFDNIAIYCPTTLINNASLMQANYTTIIITFIYSMLFIVISIFAINRKEL